jgi:hypothetical protein
VVVDDGQGVTYRGRGLGLVGGGCLVCLKLLDQEQMALDQMDQREREAGERIYGVARFAGPARPSCR